MKSGWTCETTAPAGTEHTHATRDGLLCSLVVAASLFATYPVADMGLIDDWSYIKTALDFARTGHFIFNGWGAPMLGWQVIWGAAFVKLFGTSFMAVRSSVWLLTLATVFLFHRVLLRFGISSVNAVFGTLTLGLSPLFVPLAVSFMTDIPSLFVILVCMYMCQRAVAARSDRSAIFWLCSAAITDVGGGTVRQIVWLGSLVMVPSTAWLLRRRRGILLAGILMWAAGFIAVLGFLHWFDRQPYTVSETAFISVPLNPAVSVSLPLLLVKALLCLMLILLPVLSGWLGIVGTLNPQARLRIVLIILASSFMYILFRSRGTLERAIMPWIGDIVRSQVVVASGYMLGPPPVMFRLGMRVAISLIVIATGLIFVECSIRKQSFSGAIKTGKPSWREMGWILGPYSLSYIGLLLPRAIHGFIYDRYLFLLLPVAIIALLKLYQEEVGTKPAVTGWIVLSIFALYTVASTHSLFALDRARLVAANRILASGIPRTAIQGGFEYDGWTQIQNGGHVNEPFIRVPKDGYNPNVPRLRLPPDCVLMFSAWTPAIRPKYFLTFEPMDCLAPSIFSPVHYRAWLPPFYRTVYIQQLPGGSK